MLIFDMDGTLWNTANTTLKSSNQIADKYEEVKSFTIDTINNGMGLSFKDNVVNYFPYLDKDKGSKYLNELIGNTIRLIDEDGTDIYDGVIDVIKKLSKEYKLAIVTNNNNEYVELFFKVSGLESYFTDYLGAATYNITKAEAIKIIMNRNNESDSYYIGDIKKDLDSAREAKCTFIHAKYGFGPDLKTKYYINDIKELPDKLKRIK